MSVRQYPKPLSEKSLQKKYAELNMSEEKINFIKDFLLACSNYYGCLSLRDSWEIYKQLSTVKSLPKINRIDIVRMSEVLRREKLPYYVYEIDELYEGETRTNLDREFISDYLISRGYGKHRFFYTVADRQVDYDFYVPDDLMSYVKKTPSQPDQKLLEFLGKLKVTEDEYKTEYGRVKKCSGHKGETLNSFSFMNEEETFDYRYENGEFEGHKANFEEAKRILNEINSMTEAEKIVRNLNWYENIGYFSPTEMIKYTVSEIQEAGVALTKDQLEELTYLLMEHNNNSPHMCLCGWKPVDLSSSLNLGMPSVISLGPGIQRAIADGDLDRDEIIRKFHELGLRVIDGEK